MSASSLFKLSGVAAVLSGALLGLEGALLIIVGRDLPGPGFVAAHVLMVFALMGIYLLDHRTTGILGLLGFLAASIGNLFFTAQLFVGNVIRPRVVEVLVMERHIEALDAMDAALMADFPQPPSLFGLPAFAAGLLLLAIAHLRARIRGRWAVWLMLLGPVLNLAREPLGLPIFVGDRIAPALLGIGTVWLGYVLWSQSSRGAGSAPVAE